MKIVKPFEDCNVLINGVTKIFENETKKQKVGLLVALFDTLGASFLGNVLVNKGIIRDSEGNIRAG